MFEISLIFEPIVQAMGFVLNLYFKATGSLGVSILVLSLTFSLLLLPLQKKGMQIEQRVTAKMQRVRQEVEIVRQSGRRGEALFNETELIYARNNWHPIYSIATAAGFAAMLPVLISSIILFHKWPDTIGASFLVINDLSQPDHILSGLNVLPLLMFAITFADALLRYPNDKGARVRFLAISVALLVMVYSMPSGLVLYWIGNNLTALALACIARGVPHTQIQPTDAA